MKYANISVTLKTAFCVLPHNLRGARRKVSKFTLGTLYTIKCTKCKFALPKKAGTNQSMVRNATGHIVELRGPAGLMFQWLAHYHHFT